MNFKNKEHSLKHERYWQDVYDSFHCGLNDYIPYRTKYEIENYYKIKIKCDKCHKEICRENISRHKKSFH